MPKIFPIAEAELIEARERNRKRKRGELVNGFDLKLSEIRSLITQRRIQIKRPVYPGIQHLPYCTWARVGQVLRVREPIKFFGRNPRNAIYLYAEDPSWETSSWKKLESNLMPAKAQRFTISILTTSKAWEKWYWLIDVELVDESAKIEK